MVSFDVISLFTSIPQDLAVKTVKDLLHRKGLGQHQDSLRPGDLVDLLSLCLKTYFTFQGTVYEQIKGTPMGSPFSRVIAEAVLQQLEHVAMAQYRPSFWVRYVDDTFVVIKRSQMADFVDILNSVCVDIQFTAEEEHQGKLAFLDVLMHRRPDGTLGTKVYRKPTHTDRILHYHSNHPVAHKVSCIRALFKRVDSHCNTARAKVEEKKYLFHICKLNGYPARFVKRHGALYRPPNIQQMGVLTPLTTRVALPYVSNVSEATARLLAPHNMSVAHKPVRTLRSYVMRPKDPLPMAEKSGVVYKINCKNCPSNYVGETSKRVKTRVQEHKLAIRRGEQYSQILTHMMSFGHAFDFEDVVVVANDVTKSGRLLKEAWHSQEESINRHIDLRPAHLALRAWEARSHPLRRQQSSTDGFIPLLERINTNTSRRPDTPWDADMAVRPLRPLRKETSTGPKKLIPDTLAVLPAPSGTLVTTNLNASRLEMHPPPWNGRRARNDDLATPPADVQGNSNCKPSFEGAITRSRKAMQSAGVMDSMATITASTSHSISRPIWGESEKSQFARVYEQPLSSNTGNELTAAQGRGSIVATEFNGTEKLGEMTRGRELCSDNTHKTSRVRPRHNKFHSADGRQRNGGGGEGLELTENPKRGKCFAGGNDASGLSEFVDPSRPRTGRGGESDACLNLDEVCTIQLDESLNHATITTSVIIGQPGPITRSRSRAQALTYV